MSWLAVAVRPAPRRPRGPSFYLYDLRLLAAFSLGATAGVVRRDGGLSCPPPPPSAKPPWYGAEIAEPLSRHAAAGQTAALVQTGAMGGRAMHVQVPVEVRNRLDGRWVGGFQIAEECPGGHRGRRLSDGAVLPQAFPTHDVRVAVCQTSDSWARS